MQRQPWLLALVAASGGMSWEQAVPGPWGQAWGGQEETVFCCGNGKKGILGGSCKSWEPPTPQLWPLCSYLCIYLANLGGTLVIAFFLGAWFGHQHHRPSLLAVPHGTSCCMGLSSLLTPASLHQELGTLRTDIQKLFSFGNVSVPSCFFTSPHVLGQTCVLPAAPGIAPMLLDGCRARGRAAAPWFLHGQVSPGPTLKPNSSTAATAAASPLPAPSFF